MKLNLYIVCALLILNFMSQTKAKEHNRFLNKHMVGPTPISPNTSIKKANNSTQESNLTTKVPNLTDL